MDTTSNDRFQSLMLHFHRLGGELPPLERYGITPAQVVYLDYLSKNADCRLSDLAEALQYKPASVSTMVSALETKELVSKAYEDADGRVLSLNLTPKGQEVVSEIAEFRNKRVLMILDQLDKDERETLLRLLEKILLKEEE